ncbi:hypothetical protein H6F77_03495 [Microcoleus sp. FACHB-831]|uniref:hypothetical protein n=1 Tax=Microcoleus sp. FACHB-831 TaxID=2692827 RepID=UPI001686BB77|nr:hypothetical protein [Microcoleus sp. FACHB-831]MBD1920179.1 hypothetical protein [Microcoleus sp. FACHB-831]
MAEVFPPDQYPSQDIKSVGVVPPARECVSRLGETKNGDRERHFTLMGEVLRR